MLIIVDFSTPNVLGHGAIGEAITPHLLRKPLIVKASIVIF